MHALEGTFLAVLGTVDADGVATVDIALDLSLAALVAGPAGLLQFFSVGAVTEFVAAGVCGDAIVASGDD